ncbi:hypothetical protein ACUW9M_005193 [Serratia sp. 121840015-2]
MVSFLVFVLYIIALFVLWGVRKGSYCLLSIFIITIASCVLVFITKGADYQSALEPLSKYISYYAYLLLGIGFFYFCKKLVK